MLHPPQYKKLLPAFILQQYHLVPDQEAGIYLCGCLQGRRVAGQGSALCDLLRDTMAVPVRLLSGLLGSDMSMLLHRVGVRVNTVGT